MINYITRKKLPDAHSIELVFSTITPGINKSIITALPYPSSSIINIFKNILFALRKKEKINHVTGDVHYVIPFLGLKNFNVLTIHDTIILNRTSKFSLKYWIYYIVWYKIPCYFADIITVISPKTKTELIEYGIAASKKIIIVPNPVQDTFTSKPANPLNKSNTNILFIGTTPNKNLVRVLNAIINVQCTLTVIGTIPKEYTEVIQKNNLKVIQKLSLTNEEIINEYINTDIVLFPSLYEGFGLPIIEAQAIGRPLITSNIDPMIWVAGEECAIFVDPYDILSIKNGIQQCIEDENLRKSIIKNGLINIERFRKNNIIEKYKEIYKCAGSVE